MDACIEHLGRLPSQLDLDDNQVAELLTYHRIKQKSQRVCKDCVDKSQLDEKQCFICGKTYTEKHGVVSTGKQMTPEMMTMFKAMAAKGKEKSDVFLSEKTSDDAKQKAMDNARAWCKKHNVAWHE